MTLARIGRFHVERMLGTGSFATVWLARDEDLDAWVAIKLLAENWSYHEDARRRFIEEARALRRLDSDRIVRVFEAGHLADGRPYMVMEYADRGTLEDRMRLRAQLNQPFSVREALALSVEIAECLVGVHALRIVHRDLKPSNVLFRSISRERQETMRRDGVPVAAERVLLGDFGIARRLEGALGPTMVVGSPLYMAPEQGDPARAHLADGRSDVYAAATILYELLAGTVPLGFGSVAETPEARARVEAPPLDGFRPDVSPELAAAVHRGLARDPDARFPGAWEWREALRRQLSVANEPGPVGALGPRAGVASRPDEGTTAPSRRLSAVPGPSGRPGGAGPWGRTAPARPPGTDVMPDEAGHTGPVERPAAGAVPAVGTSPGVAPPADASARAAPPVGLKWPAAATVAAGLGLLVGVLLPWTADSLGAAHAEGTYAVGVGILLLLAGLRMLRTRRRWVAIVWSGLAVPAGLGAVFLALWVTATEGATGPGLLTLVASGAAAAFSGNRALGRLRRDPRRWSPPSAH